MMTLKSYVAMALFICGVAWLVATGSQRADAQRQAVASQYSLGAQQMTVYDKCIAAMEHKGLRAGGSKQQFCGCLVQRGRPRTAGKGHCGARLGGNVRCSIRPRFLHSR